MKLTIGLCRNASQTAGDGHWHVQSPNPLPIHPYATSSPPDRSPGGFRIGLERGIGTSPPRLTVKGWPRYSTSTSSTSASRAVYADLLDWETAIVEAVLFTVNRTSQAEGVYFQTRFVDTITDEDRLPHYKIFASRFEVEG